MRKSETLPPQLEGKGEGSVGSGLGLSGRSMPAGKCCLRQACKQVSSARSADCQRLPGVRGV